MVRGTWLQSVLIPTPHITTAHPLNSIVTSIPSKLSLTVTTASTTAHTPKDRLEIPSELLPKQTLDREYVFAFPPIILTSVFAFDAIIPKPRRPTILQDTISHISFSPTSPTGTMASIVKNKRAKSVAVPSTFIISPPPRSTSLGGTASTSNSSQESHEATPRRLNRKLPPALTESLLALERFETRTSDEHGSPREDQMYRRESDESCGCDSVQSTSTLTPPWNPPAEFMKYTLVVEPPQEDTCTVYEPKPKATKRVVARHQSRVEPLMIDTQRPLSLTFESIDDLSRPLSPAYSRNNPVSSTSLFKSNWPSRRPQTPTAVPELAPPSLVSDSTASSSGWSALRELEEREREERLKPKAKETRKEKKLRRQTEKENFDSETPPGLRDLFNASLCEVVDEHGNKTSFGDLVTGKRTIVIFIRHCTSPLLPPDMADPQGSVHYVLNT